MTIRPTDDYVHLALVPLDGPPRPQCDGSGRSVMRIEEVTCPDCLQQLGGRVLVVTETEVHDAHAIPANDEPAPADTLVLPWQNPILIDKDGDRWRVVAYQADSDLTIPISVVRRDYGPLTVAGAGQAKRCPSCPHCGQTFHIEPAKTHDLSIRRTRNGNVSIAVEGEGAEVQVYLLDGVALDLGQALALLTPTQRQLLIDDLTGGGS